MKTHLARSSLRSSEIRRPELTQIADGMNKHVFVYVAHTYLRMHMMFIKSALLFCYNQDALLFFANLSEALHDELYLLPEVAL